MARTVLALTAVLILAWVGVLLRNFEIGHDGANKAFSPNLSRAERDRNLERVKQAQLLDPHSDWKLSRADYYLVSGRLRKAALLAEEIVRDEPENIGAWGALAQATSRSDPARAAQAASQIKRLDPLGSR